MPERSLTPLLEESLDDLYEHAPCGYVSALPDGTIVKVNQTFLEWTGYTRDELVRRRRFQDLLTPGGQIYHETHYSPLLHMQGSVREIALKIRRADGSRLPVLVNSVLRTAPGGDQAVVRTTVFDASDRSAYERELLLARRQEAEARERTERLQRLTEALSVALDEHAVADATLGVVLEAVEAGAASIEVVSDDGGGRLGQLAARGEGALGFDEELDLPGSHGSLGRMLVGVAGRTLTEQERHLLVACARLCAQALERARLHSATARAAERAALLAELARDLAEVRSYDERARCLVELLVKQLVDEARLESSDELGGRTLVAQASSGAESCPFGVELPLRRAGQPVGTLIVRRRTEFSPDDRRFLADVADRAALALENARLYEHQHEVADALQRSMLTDQLPQDARYRLAAHYVPALEWMSVGGDWYDAFALGDARLALVVGDVVGRGLEAATAMGQLRSAVRALAAAAEGPAELIERLDAFVEPVPIAQSATLVYAEVDLAGGLMRYASAGHPPPVLLTSDGSAELLWGGRSPPLGVVPPSGRSEAEVALTPGSSLFMYTDGLIERRDRPLDDSFAELLGAVRQNAEAPLAAVVADLPEILLDRQRVRDDVCLLGMSFVSAR